MLLRILILALGLQVAFPLAASHGEVRFICEEERYGWVEPSGEARYTIAPPAADDLSYSDKAWVVTEAGEKRPSFWCEAALTSG